MLGRGMEAGCVGRQCILSPGRREWKCPLYSPGCSVEHECDCVPLFALFSQGKQQMLAVNTGKCKRLNNEPKWWLNGIINGICVQIVNKD